MSEYKNVFHEQVIDGGTLRVIVMVPAEMEPTGPVALGIIHQAARQKSGGRSAYPQPGQVRLATQQDIDDIP